MVSKKIVAAVGSGAVAGAIGVSLAGGAFTASAASPTPKATTSHAAAGHAKAGKRAGRRFDALGRVVHGTGVVRTKTGFETLAVDRGTVSAVTGTTVTITSADKAHETFTVVPSSRVRVDGAKGTLSQVKTGETAQVLAVVNGSANGAPVMDVKLLVVRPAGSGTATTGPSTGA